MKINRSRKHTAAKVRQLVMDKKKQYREIDLTLTDREICEQIGWNSGGQVLSNIMRGKCDIPLKFFVRFCEYFKISLLAMRDLRILDEMETIDNELTRQLKQQESNKEISNVSIF